MMIESVSSHDQSFDQSRIGPAADPEQQHQSEREHRPYHPEDDQRERRIVEAEDQRRVRSAVP
jgi:hypothetical protein